MGKKQVDQYIPAAYEALREVKIVEAGKVNKRFRSQIASFGAMVAMGSVLSAIALYSGKREKSGESGTERDKAREYREKLIKAICYLVMDKQQDANEFRIYVQKEIQGNGEYKVKEKILDAAVAIKLAINFYEIIEDGSEVKKGEFTL